MIYPARMVGSKFSASLRIKFLLAMVYLLVIDCWLKLIDILILFSDGWPKYRVHGLAEDGRFGKRGCRVLEPSSGQG